jgi:hypothetical protein
VLIALILAFFAKQQYNEKNPAGNEGSSYAGAGINSVTQ